MAVMNQLIHPAVAYGHRGTCSFEREARTGYPIRAVSKDLYCSRQLSAHAAIEGSSSHFLPRGSAICGFIRRANMKATTSEESITDEGRTACSSNAHSTWSDRMPRAEVLILDATSIACQSLGDPTTFSAFISFLEAVVQPVTTIAIFDPEKVPNARTRSAILHLAWASLLFKLHCVPLSSVEVVYRLLSIIKKNEDRCRFFAS